MSKTFKDSVDRKLKEFERRDKKSDQAQLRRMASKLDRKIAKSKGQNRGR